MKQRKVVSVIGALVLIISAVALITGCPQANNNTGNTNTSGSSNVNLVGTVWYGGGYGYLYFSDSKVYMCYHNNGTVTIDSSGTYTKDKMIMDSGETILIKSITESVLKIPAPNEIDTITYTRETDVSLINTIKSGCH